MKKLSDLIEKINESPPLSFQQFTKVKDMPDTEPWLSIKEYYNHPSIGVRAFGIIMNGVLTNKKTKFLLSFRIFNGWLEMQGEEAISGKTYKKVLAQLTDPKIQFMKCTSIPSTYGSNEKRAGTYEITLELLTKYVNK